MSESRATHSDDDATPRPRDFEIPTIDQLDKMRVAQDLNQRDLSRQAGLEPGRFNHILHGDVDPHVSTMRAFLHALQHGDGPDIMEPEHGPDPEPSPHAGRKRCWDGEDCPHEDCDGELGQQDRLNVMCRTCEDVWTHVKTDTKHKLQTADYEFVAEKPRAIADGGFESAETEWSRRVSSESAIRSLASDLEVGIHNMWVDIRGAKDMQTGEYDLVTVEVTVTVTGGELDD